MTATRTTVTVITAAVCFFAITNRAAAAEPAATAPAAHEATAPAAHDATAVAAAAAKFVGDYATKAVCSYSPDFCAKHQLQSRGIQSYLATAGTLFAGVLGVILTKIKILIVLSLMSTVIGKMLLFYAFFKAHDPYHHHHIHKPHHHAPFVKYTRDKYYIKHTPSEHSHDVIVGPEHHHTPYHGHQPSGGVSYYKR